MGEKFGVQRTTIAPRVPQYTCCHCTHCHMLLFSDLVEAKSWWNWAANSCSLDGLCCNPQEVLGFGESPCELTQSVNERSKIGARTFPCAGHPSLSFPSPSPLSWWESLGCAPILEMPGLLYLQMLLSFYVRRPQQLPGYDYFSGNRSQKLVYVR